MGLGDALEIEFVCVTLAVHLGHDVLVIVVAEGTAELVIVHVRLAFSLPQRLATSSGSVILNSPFVPSQVMMVELLLSDSSSNKNCHSWI